MTALRAESVSGAAEPRTVEVESPSGESTRP